MLTQGVSTLGDDLKDPRERDVDEAAIASVKIDEPSAVQKPGQLITHADLMRLEFVQQRWIVEGMVPDESLIFLGGKKKLGKSWMCLQLAQAVAHGDGFLGRETAQGSVLYLCLEDGRRRLQQRLVKQRASDDLPIRYVTELKPLDRGGLDRLRQLVREHGPDLVIIDTLAAARSGKVDEDKAGPVGELVNPIRRLAQEEGVAILVVVHHGKSITGDPGHDIRGSSAAPAAADVNLGLYRDGARRTLKGEGRDIEDFELPVAFDNRRTWKWRVVEDARDAARTAKEERVIETVRKLTEANAEWVDAEAIAQGMGTTRQAVQAVLPRLRGGALLYRVEKGTGRVLYRVAEAPEADRDDGDEEEEEEEERGK